MTTLDPPRTEYLTVDECAARLRVSHGTIRALIHCGALPALRVGQQLRVKSDDLDRHLKAKVADRV